MSAPHHLFLEHRRLCLVAAAASLVLSLWAIHVDPVVNNDGILYIEAAHHFGAGDWRAGFAVYKWPFYSIVISAVSALGLPEGHSAYLLNGLLYVLLVLGFVAFVQALGGGRTAMWSAAAIALAHPVLNEFRSFIIRDIGYWACYLWSLAYLFAYLNQERRSLLFAWAVLAILAFLFRIEGIVLVTVLPACLYAAGTAGVHRAVALSAVAGIGLLVVAAAPLWHYMSEVGFSGNALVSSPLQHIVESWRSGTGELAARLDALERDFPGVSGDLASFGVYLCAVLLIVAGELIQSVGIVFTGLAIYASWRLPRLMPDRTMKWWLIVVGIQVLLVLIFAFSNFFLTERYPLGLALSILAIIPLLLEEIWHRSPWKSKAWSWRAVVIAVLLTIEVVDGLNLATGKLYIKEAGLWVRQHAVPGSTIYSNNRILVYYSGLKDYDTEDSYSWQEAMSKVWNDEWRKYDFFVLVMNVNEARDELLLFRKISSKPVKTFTNKDGDQVLIFRPG